jgi:hypothetical protein
MTKNLSAHLPEEHYPGEPGRPWRGSMEEDRPDVGSRTASARPL